MFRSFAQIVCLGIGLFFTVGSLFGESHTGVGGGNTGLTDLRNSKGEIIKFELGSAHPRQAELIEAIGRVELPLRLRSEMLAFFGHTGVLYSNETVLYGDTLTQLQQVLRRVEKITETQPGSPPKVTVKEDYDVVKSPGALNLDVLPINIVATNTNEAPVAAILESSGGGIRVRYFTTVLENVQKNSGPDAVDELVLHEMAHTLDYLGGLRKDEAFVVGWTKTLHAYLQSGGGNSEAASAFFRVLRMHHLRVDTPDSYMFPEESFSGNDKYTGQISFVVKPGEIVNYGIERTPWFQVPTKVFDNYPPIKNALLKKDVATIDLPLEIITDGTYKIARRYLEFLRSSAQPLIVTIRFAFTKDFRNFSNGVRVAEYDFSAFNLVLPNDPSLDSIPTRMLQAIGYPEIVQSVEIRWPLRGYLAMLAVMLPDGPAQLSEGFVRLAGRIRLALDRMKTDNPVDFESLPYSSQKHMAFWIDNGTSRGNNATILWLDVNPLDIENSHFVESLMKILIPDGNEHYFMHKKKLAADLKETMNQFQATVPRWLLEVRLDRCCSGPILSELDRFIEGVDDGKLEDGVSVFKYLTNPSQATLVARLHCLANAIPPLYQPLKLRVMLTKESRISWSFGAGRKDEEFFTLDLMVQRSLLVGHPDKLTQWLVNTMLDPSNFRSSFLTPIMGYLADWNPYTQTLTPLPDVVKCEGTLRDSYNYWKKLVKACQ